MRRVLAIGLLTAASVAAAGGDINGNYQTKLAGMSPSQLNGTWQLSIAQKRAYIVTQNGKPVIGGKLKVAGPTLTFTDTSGPYACPPAQAVGVYTYSLSGTTLKLTRVKDNCSGRALILTAHKLTRV